MVAELVGDHVGLGEVAGGPEAISQLSEEAEVEIDLEIRGAVEGPDGGRGGAAARC